MTICVVIIALGGMVTDKEDNGAGGIGYDLTEEEDKERLLNVVLAIVFALLTAGAFAFNVVSIQFCVDLNFDVQQANFDGWVILACFTFPAYWYELYVNEFPFTFKDTILATLTQSLVVFGVIMLSQAVKFGVAATVTAVENSKTIV